MKKQCWLWGLAIAGLLAETLVPLPVWAIEPQTIQGELDGTEAKFDDGSFYDSYEMAGKTGESVALTLDSPAFDTYLLLLDPAGKTLAEQDDGDGSNVRLVVMLPQDGRYRIVATSSKPGDKGAYTLRWQPATPEDVAHFQKKTEADRLFEQGNQDFNANQFQDALQAWQQALEYYRFLKDLKKEGATLNNFGNAYHSMGQYQKAKEYYLKSLDIARETGNRKVEAASLDNLGSSSLFLGDYPQAIHYHEQSLAIEQELGNRKAEAMSLGNLANVYHLMAQYERAIDYHEQDLKISQEIGDKKGEAAALGGLGNAYQSLGQYQRAIDHHSQSLAINKEIGNRQGVAISLANLGNAYDSLGQYHRAINYHEQSLQIAQELHDRSGEMMSLSSLGQAYSALGQYQRAIAAQEQSLMIAQEIGYRSAQASILVSLGNIYQSIGQYQRAMSYNEKALIITVQIGDRNGEARILGNLGIVYKSLGQYQKAIENYQKALLIQQQVGDLQGQAGSLGNLGNVSGLLGHYSAAIDYHEKSLVIERQIGNRRGEAVSLGNLGDAYYFLKQYPKAISFYQQTLVITREIGDRQSEAISLNSLGNTYFIANRLPEAESALRASLAVHEAIQRDVGQNDRDRVSLLETQQKTYLNLQRTLIGLKKIPEALEAADRSRARSLLSFLTEKTSPANSNLSATEIQAVARQQNATIVLYSEVWGELYLWVVPPSGDISFRRVPLPKDNSNLAQTAESLRNSAITTRLLVSRGQESGAIAQLANQLRSGSSQTTTFSTTSLRQGYDLLIKPIADLLPQTPAAKLIIVPHRELALVPFVALRDDQGKFLIDRYTLAIAPSVSVLAEAARQPQTTNGQPLIIGNPAPMPDSLIPLPGAEAEAQAIAQTLNATPVIGSQATETAIKAKIDQASLLHFATHGTIAQTAAGELDSWLALAPGDNEDGKLTIAEIFDRRLSARLAVLSACDTGKGNVSGEGVVGLARAFLKAGVPTVVASLWKVPDQPTALMMQAFYAERATGKDAPTALRSALLTVRKTYPGPQNWAAFVAIGDTISPTP